MEQIIFDIYIPNEKKFRWTPNIIMTIIGIAVTIALLQSNLHIPASIQFNIAVSALVIYIFYIIRSLITYKPLNGQLNGRIEFTDNNVKVREATYTMDDIKKIDFYFGDYYGKSEHTYRSVNSILSQGVNNSIEFVTCNGERHNIQFKMRTKNGYLVLAPFINNALKAQKIPHFKAVDLIGEENIY
jgi:hypothetical protein